MANALTTLLASPGAAPFIYLHHPHHPSTSAIPVLPARCITAHLDAIEHHTPRLLLSGALNKLASALGQEEEGEVTTWDGFARRLREIWKQDKGKKKGKAADDGPKHEERQVVLVITKAERLRTVLTGGWAVVTRLAELTGVPATVILASAAPWDELRPLRGDAPEPVHVYLPAVSREDVLRDLLPGSAHPLYPRFLDLLLATVSSLIPSASSAELDYLAECLWPIYTSSLPPHLEQPLLNRPLPNPDIPPPPLTITVKLLTDLKHQLSVPLAAAVENVLPRLTGRAEFFDALTRGRAVPKPPTLELPICARFLLVAGYCASYNPVKSDLRLFGRGTGPDGKRRRGGGFRRAGYGRTRIGKVPQRLLGPKPFPLDRMLALFASLYAEHGTRPEDLQAAVNGAESDSESDEDGWLATTGQAERKRKREVERDERWEDEVDHLTMSVKLWSLIPELEAHGLLRRVSPPDRLDNVMLRCELDIETARALAKDLRITLDEYLYEATS